MLRRPFISVALMSAILSMNSSTVSAAGCAKYVVDRPGGCLQLYYLDGTLYTCKADGSVVFGPGSTSGSYTILFRGQHENNNRVKGASAYLSYLSWHASCPALALST